MGIASIIIGIYLIILAFIITTKKFKDCFIYQIIPFFLGVISIAIGLNLLEIISINI